MTTKKSESGITRKGSLSTRRKALITAAVSVLVVATAYVLFRVPTFKSPFTTPETNPPNPTATQLTITFDFDTVSPSLIEGQNTPINQTSDGLTAHFSSPSDAATPAFSVQSYETTFFVLPQFSGKWLYDNKPSNDVLDIMFSRQLTCINLTFATLEYHGGPSTEPTEIKLTAYTNSTNTPLVGSATSRGTWPSGGLYPQGTLSFTSNSEPFKLVRIEISFVPQGATDFFVDNIVVTTVEAE